MFADQQNKIKITSKPTRFPLNPSLSVCPGRQHVVVRAGAVLGGDHAALPHLHRHVRAGGRGSRPRVRTARG